MGMTYKFKKAKRADLLGVKCTSAIENGLVMVYEVSD